MALKRPAEQPSEGDAMAAKRPRLAAGAEGDAAGDISRQQSSPEESRIALVEVAQAPSLGHAPGDASSQVPGQWVLENETLTTSEDGGHTTIATFGHTTETALVFYDRAPESVDAQLARDISLF